MRTAEPLPLPALHGLDPLGFLASLGLLDLLAHRGLDVRLSFDATSATARVHGVASIDEIVEQLVAATAELPEEGLMPGLPAELPPRKVGNSGSDPARLDPQQFKRLVHDATDSRTTRWIRALWTDLAVGDDNRCAFTPFSAPTGQQTMRSMFEKPIEAVRVDPQARFEEALRAWRRLDGFTGENLDFRAVRGAAEQPDGKATMTGVPGATWLALAAIPFFPMGGDGVRARTRRWLLLRFPRQGRRRMAFTWPIWSQPLDVDAVDALLSHAALDRAAEKAAGDPSAEPAIRSALNAIGVERVLVAHRRQLPGGKAAGVLVPAGSWR